MQFKLFKDVCSKLCLFDVWLVCQYFSTSKKIRNNYHKLNYHESFALGAINLSFQILDFFENKRGGIFFFCLVKLGLPRSVRNVDRLGPRKVRTLPQGLVID